MNNDLIKRIDALLSLRVESSATSTINNDCPLDPDVEKALRDCRAEIASLHEAAQQQAVVIERPSKPYVPMTDEQVGMLTVFDGLHNVETPILAEYIRNIETAVIKRLGREIKHETEQ